MTCNESIRLRLNRALRRGGKRQALFSSEDQVHKGLPLAGDSKVLNKWGPRLLFWGPEVETEAQSGKGGNHHCHFSFLTAEAQRR